MYIQRKNKRKEKHNVGNFAAVIAVVGMCGSMLQGCDRQKTIAYFNGIEEASINSAGTELENEAINTDETELEHIAERDDTEELDTSLQEQPYTGSEVSIIMVGDILLHTPVAESGVQEDGSYNFDALFYNVKDEISEADLAIVNQEVIIGGLMWCCMPQIMHWIREKRESKTASPFGKRIILTLRYLVSTRAKMHRMIFLCMSRRESVSRF